MRVTPTDINAAEPFQVEFKILNTGTAHIELPVSPNLSDLQPNDESVAFNYSSLALVVRGEAEPQEPPVDSTGFVELFGSSDHAESMMVLRLLLRFERIDYWERIASRWRPAFSSHLSH
jgi:hypothetical protein